ncbi:hypothetical protein B7494_g1732 [Chlorociboria aeruginascens]|nr:hypothetical protein B7494_g1732 [Chlorociboria aeruginascens]
MVYFQTVQQSNSRITALPQGIIALFMGATSGIGQSALQHFAQNAPSPRIYTVARPPTVASHEDLLTSLRQINPSGAYSLITADISLVSEIDKVVNAIKQKETRIDILFMSSGFMAFEGRRDTREGLEPSMTTRYYSRIRAVQKLLPLLNNAAVPSPRIVSVLAGGKEGPLNEEDLDLRDSTNWSFWNAAVHATTMGTLMLERIARENPRLSIVHWFPGPVATPAMTKAQKFGRSFPNPTSQEEAGARAVFLATSDRYAVEGGGLVPAPEGLGVIKKSGGGIFLVDPDGESTDNEELLSTLRTRGVDEKTEEYRDGSDWGSWSMSQLALEVGGFDLPQWEGYSDFLDQSTSYFDAGANEWLSDTMSQYISSPGTFIQNSASSVDVASTTSVSSADQEPLIRRRTQVRLAQQAYRHRKEATVASLKVEIEDLKSRLTNIQFSFDQLQAITLRSGLQSSENNIVQSLSKVVEQYRLPLAYPRDSDQSDNSKELVQWKDQYLAPSAVDPAPTLNNSQGAEISIYTPLNLPHSQDSSVGISNNLQTGFQNLKGLSIPLLDQLPSTPVPFALRLRHEALKCGYHLITSQEASFASLSRPFKYHMFSESRDSIAKRLQYQLYLSAKFIYQSGSGSEEPLADPFDSEPATVKVDEKDAFINSNAVERYLIEKGLGITAESTVISVPAGTTFQDSPTPTLFDEMRGGRELKLSVGKLLHELLSKVKCLDNMGPAFRRVEVDEALRSTMIEAI